MKKRILCLLVCTVMLMAVAAMAVFAEEPVALGVTYSTEKTVFCYKNPDATEVKVRLHATLTDDDEAAEVLGEHAMTKGEDGIWTVSVEGDLQQMFYTYVCTVNGEQTEIADPNNSPKGEERSYIKFIERYDLWVDGIRVTSDNARDILGDADRGAAVRYNAKSNMLVLADGANITSEGTAIVYKGKEPLSIGLEGSATVSGKTGAIEAVDGGNEIKIINEGMADLIASSEAGNAVTVGSSGKLTVGANVSVQLVGKTGLALGEKASVEIEAGSKLIAEGSAADIEMADSAQPLSMALFSEGRLKLTNNKLSGFISAGNDEKYTYAGAVFNGAGIAVTAETPSNVCWITDSVNGIGNGLVYYVSDGQTHTLSLCGARINNTKGAGISAGDMDILLEPRGVNTVKGSTVGMEAGSITVKGVHGMVSANGVSTARGLILKAGIVEIERKSPIFANGAPDLSQGNSGYTAVAGADKETAAEYSAEAAATYLYFKFTATGKNNLGKWTEGKQPTCSHSGTSGYYVCGACNTRVDADGLEVISTILPPDPEAHNYDRYVPAENGKHKKMCSYNNVHVIMEFCSGGTASCTEKATCAFCEMSYGWVLYHDFGGEFTEKNDMGHWKICRRAGCGAADDAKAHTGGVTSCEDPYFCTVCGHEYGEAAGHSYTTKASGIKVSEASCASAEEYLVQCDRCDSVHETLTVQVGESLPHTFGSEWVSGQEGHWHVCFCGARTEPEYHLEKVINQVKATEWKDGYTGDIYCEVCGFEVVKGVSVPAFGSTGADNGEWLAILCVILLVLSGLGLTVSVVLGIRNKKKTAQ